MYTNPNQYANQGYQNAYPQYQQNYNSSYGYDEYGQYMNTNVQPVPPGEEYPQNSWAPVSGGYANAQQQQQQQQQHHGNIPTHGFDNKLEDNKKEALAQEIKQQNAQLIKQREDYVRKAAVLRRELDLLRNQKKDIMSEKSPQRDMELILNENDKLQDEIQSKMKAIYNVIEMLSSIIKDGRNVSDLEAQLDESPKLQKSNQYQQQQQHQQQHSYSEALESAKFNYIHYDPELHWCRTCDEFPRTAKDLLLHLQGGKHMENMQKNDVGDNTPWHKLPPENELPCYEGAPKKRIPIRGLQFFISAPSWYCKLCDTWIGDLHCASQHLKSHLHFQNYANFVEQNPHWEIEWLKDREKAMARDGKLNSSDSDSARSSKKKRKHKTKRTSIEQSSSAKDKKKKKRSKKRRKHSSDSSSSSSSSDTSSDDDKLNDKSKSIRVAMRNMKVQSIMNEDLSGKWEMLERMVDEHKKKEEMQKLKETSSNASDNTDNNNKINQWNTISGPVPADKEKVLLDNLKDRMKQKQELEKARMAEVERRHRDKEREENELHEKKVRDEQETRERFERERRDRERQEYERIQDKDRSQVRFKATRDNYRRRRTPSPSPERRTPPNRKHYRRNNSPQRSSSSSNHHRNGRDTKPRSRSKSKDQSNNNNNNNNNSSKYDDDTHNKKKQPPGPPKRLPFIGRMPLFKNKKPEDKAEKELKKEDYDIPRQTRFQPGNLARAFLPQPDVVCFPKLSSYPPLSAPPAPIVSPPDPPAPPNISASLDNQLKAPPAPKIGGNTNNKIDSNKLLNNDGGGASSSSKVDEEDEMLYDPNQIVDHTQYYTEAQYNMMYSHMYGYQTTDGGNFLTAQPTTGNDENIPLSHTMPLQPPPLPPNDPDDDDLALLGISADDMAAQSF